MSIYTTTEREFGSEFARDIEQGLLKKNKEIKSKYFYDNIGSRLFEQITFQPEYYLAATERAILEEYSRQITSDFNLKDASILELGSGSSTKTRILLSRILASGRLSYYFPIDVSQKILSETIERLTFDFPKLRVFGIGSEYITGIRKANEIISSQRNIPSRKVLLFLGSSIGNFEPNECRCFLKNTAECLQSDDIIIIGFDLQKNKELLEPAYNDKAQVTSNFNLNLLSRINRELGGEFELDKFKHFAFYNEKDSRIEMRLISTGNQDVSIKKINRTFSFADTESIHTENSYKYSLEQIENIASDSGFSVKKSFFDAKKWFSLSVLALS
jgi:dimethylhistidine N-methyltransferase